MSEDNTERVTDPTAAAEAARAELAARVDELRRSGWTKPVENRRCLIYKNTASDEQRAAPREQLRRQYAAAKARAEKVLGRGLQRERIVYKTTVTARPSPDIPELSKSGVPMTEVKTTNAEHPLEVLADELGIVAARIEREAILKVKALRGELELSLERRLMEQAKEIAELRGQLSVLLTRAARVEQPDQLIDFNQARAATRN